MLKPVSQGVIASFFLLLGVNYAVSAQTKTIIRNQPVARRLNVIHVNPISGNDQTGKGTLQAPFRSITNALVQAKFNTTIRLAPGTYSINNGERFPLELKTGITIQGNEATQGRGTVILGGGNFLSPTLTAKNITVLGSDFSELRGVTITNKNPRGYGLWIEGTSPKVIGNTFTGNTQDGIMALGTSTALISKNIFIRNGANGMSIEGMAQPEVNSNRFDNTGYGIIIRQNATPQILNNVIGNNRSGILIQPSSSPVLRNNIIERNRQTGITILGDSSPDLGRVDSAGNNIIRNNLQRDVQYTGSNPIAAVGNQILRISGNLQLTGTLQANIPSPNVPRTSLNTNVPIRTIIPNSVVVRTFPAESTQPLPTNTTIDSSLPPIVLTPPAGATVNRTPNRNPITNNNTNSITNNNGGRRVILITREAPTQPIPSQPVPLRYRVVVPSNAPTSKEEIQKIVPTAFRARMNGQEVIQVGVFSDRTAADEQVKILAQAGFNAEVASFSAQ